MYYESSVPMTNLFWENPAGYFKVLFSAPTEELRSYFNYDTGYPYSYMYLESKTCMVIKLTSVLLIFGFKSYLITTVLLSSLAYYGLWKIYTLLNMYYPELRKYFAWGVLLVPSVIFWGSGILKDTYTMAATGMIVFGYWQVFLNKKYRKFSGWAQFIIGAYILLAIKPYIIMVLLPALFMWFIFDRVYQLRNVLVLAIALPAGIGFFMLASYFLFSGLGDTLSKFSLDSALENAKVIQQDLMREEQYGGNSFNIGKFDGSLNSAVSLFPNAVFAGLYRPMIIESRNIVMILSGLENTVLLVLTVFVLVRVGLRRCWAIIRTNSFIVFALIFSIFFAFVIGLTTSNFGAMVRFKIPLFPFFLAGLTIIYFYDSIILAQRAVEENKQVADEERKNQGSA